MSETRLVKIYKTRRKRDMYLYVDFRDDLSRVPEALMNEFGAPEFAFSITLTTERKLARADAATVLEQIEIKGYYLQMPPTDGGVEAQIRRSAR